MKPSEKHPGVARRHPWHLAALIVATFILASLCSPRAMAQGAGYWHTSGNQIVDSSGQAVRIAGINWYGFETTDELIHGLWAQDYKTILNEIKTNGYNTIRMPFSNQMVEQPINPTNFTQNVNGQAVNTDLVGLNSLQIMDKVITAAGAVGLKVILDNHRSEAGNSNEASGLWYTSAFPESNWINDWVTLAKRYQSFTDANGNPIVIGMDLRNEPHVLANGQRTGACWEGDTSTGGCPASNTAQNWTEAATRAGNAILAVNPKLLIFVEGNDCYNADCGWQGGMLEGVATNPVTLSVPNQLVYSAHDYGPNVFQQPWFNSTTTAASLEAIWNKDWFFVSKNGIAPLWLGEFGTPNNATDIQSATPGSEGQWFSSLVAFIGNWPNLSWSYWAANGEDSFALLTSQYDGIANSQKQSMLAALQFPLGTGTTGGGTFSLSATPSSLMINQGASGMSTITVAPTGGFAGQVALSATGLPAGVTATFSPTSTTGTSTLTLTASGTAVTGPATVVVNGVSGTLSNTASITLTVNPVQGNQTFSLSASPASVTVVQGGASASSTISVALTPGSTAPGQVSLTASGLPAGVTATFAPQATAAPGTSTLTFAASGTAATGPATVVVTGMSGSESHTVNVTLTVNPMQNGGGDFSLSANPASLTIAQGASGPSTITVTPSGNFTGQVSLSAAGLPPGVTATFSPQSTTGTSVMTLSASNTAAATAAPVMVTIMGTSGSLSHSTSVMLTVTAVNQGGGACHVNYVVTGQWPGGFNTNITITNTGSTALSNWTLTWSFANGQTVTQLWNGNVTQSGPNVSVSNMSYNGSIAAGASYSGLGFNGSWDNTTNAVPTSFALNGTPCN